MSRLLPVLGGCLLLVACGSDPSPRSGPPEPSTGPATVVETTPRALVAAVERQLGRRAILAAPIFASQAGGGATDDFLAVEVAFDEEDWDNSHVGLGVTGDLASFEGEPCDGPENRYAAGCEESVTAEGLDLRLQWTAASFESDPGGIQATARHRDRVVVATYVGKEVPEDLAGSPLAGVADDLVDLATDPDVGLETSADLAAAGEEIPDDVLLDWFGQDNGAPRPPELRTDGGRGEDPTAFPATPRSLAAAVLRHVDLRPLAAGPVDTVDVMDVEASGRSGSGPAVGVDLEPARGFDGSADLIPWRVSLAVYPAGTAGSRSCAQQPGVYSCAEAATASGSPVRIRWQVREPEEDPGVLAVDTARGGRLVVASLVGPGVVGDPRDGDLAPVTDQLVALVGDPAVGHRTSPSLVEAAEQIPRGVWQEIP